MPFEAAHAKLTTYMTKRLEQLEGNNAVTLFMDGESSLAEAIDETFNSEEENARWSDLVHSGAEIYPVMQVRTKIGWLAACRRDLREQFACTESASVRAGADHARFNAESVLQATRGLRLFYDFMAGEA